MIETKIGGQILRWEVLPSSAEGKTRIFDPAMDSWIEVLWKVDSQGIRLKMGDRVVGFDICIRRDEDARLSMDITERNVGTVWKNIRLGDNADAVTAGSQAGVSKKTRVRCQMPGRVIRILVKKGDQVQKGQSLLVLEAMKMENEIRALISGEVTDIKVSEGQTVESGVELLTLNG